MKTEDIKVEFRDEVQDTITGIKGKVVAVTEWIVGCRRITIMPKPKQGSTEMPEGITIDEPLLKIIKRANPKTKPVSKKNGGPLPMKISRY